MSINRNAVTHTPHHSRQGVKRKADESRYERNWRFLNHPAMPVGVSEPRSPCSPACRGSLASTSRDKGVAAPGAGVTPPALPWRETPERVVCPPSARENSAFS